MSDLSSFTRRLADETDCSDVHQRLAAGDRTLVLIDARAESDHRARRLPTAVSLPHRDIDSARLDQLVIAPATEFVTYCWGPHCNAATKAAARIAELGHPVREMIGGVWGWEQEGFAFEGEEVRTTVGLLTFAGMDLLDFGGPYEVLLTANRLLARAGRPQAFDLITIGDPMRAFGGLALTPTVTVGDAPRLDVLVVPGAVDLEAARPDESLRALAPRSRVLATVCTGIFFLQRNGMLDDRPVTTHWEDVGELDHPDVRDDVRWIDHGDLITSGGISSGIAMALHLVERFVGRPLAEATARQIDYVWTEQRQPA